MAKRTAFRAPTTLPAALSLGSSLDPAEVRDLSRGGAYLLAASAPAVGGAVELRLPAGEVPAALAGPLRAEVVRVQPAAVDAGEAGGAPGAVGVGLRFVDLDDERRRGLGELVDDSIARSVFDVDTDAHLEEARRALARYEFEDHIACGGSAHVFRARDTRLDDLMAIKVFHETDEDDLQARIHREIRMARRVKSERVASIFDFGQIGGRSYVAMDYVPGDTLQERVTEAGPIPEERTIELLLQVLEGVDAIHRRGIIHRDLKPANIILTPEGGPVLVDLGLARRPVDPLITQHSQLLGTPAYMAPEQVQGEPLGPASDLYALGCIAFFMLTGRPPFLSDNPLKTAVQHVRQPVPSLSSLGAPAAPELEELLGACLSKRPGDRFASTAELSAALRQLLAASKDPTSTLSPPALLWLAIESAPIAELLERELGGGEAQLLRVPQGYQVVEKVLDRGGDAIFLEVGRAQPEGLEIVQTLRSFPDTRDVPIVLFAEDAALRAATGPDPRTRVLTPPYTREDLARVLTELGVATD